MKKKALFAIILGAALLNTGIPALTAGQAQAKKEAAKKETKPKCLEAVEFLTGFGWGQLHAIRNYNLYPLLVDFDFDLKPLLNKLNIRPPVLVQFQIEPFISVISSPKTNIETGTSFSLKIGLLPQTSKFQPYIKAGAGLDYMTLHTGEQATQFNFIEYGGAGIHYYFRKNTAITLEGRFRHLSNSGIDHPNHGINTYFALAGITYQF